MVVVVVAPGLTNGQKSQYRTGEHSPFQSEPGRAREGPSSRFGGRSPVGSEEARLSDWGIGGEGLGGGLGEV